MTLAEDLQGFTPDSRKWLHWKRVYLVGNRCPASERMHLQEKKKKKKISIQFSSFRSANLLVYSMAQSKFSEFLSGREEGWQVDAGTDWAVLTCAFPWILRT